MLIKFSRMNSNEFIKMFPAQIKSNLRFYQYYLNC